MAAKLILLGKQVTFVVAPLSINATTGAITVGTTAALTGKAKRASIRFDKRTFEANALDADIVNNLPYLNDWSLVLSAIKFKAGTVPNPLEDLAMANDHGQVAMTTPTRVWTFQGPIKGLGWDINPEENLDEITLIPMDIGGPNPTWVSVP